MPALADEWLGLLTIVRMNYLPDAGFTSKCWTRFSRTF